MEPTLSFKFKNNELEIVLRYKLNTKYEEDSDSEYSLFFIVNERDKTKVGEFLLKKFE